ncbi:MAG: hypothetical protein IPN18_10465 [Ignavibacteriales bacterium]|nr:hypothetical protein [Ignavibacteriales bacterium]
MHTEHRLKISNAIIKNASCGIYSHVSPGDTIDGVSTENTHTGISLYYSYNYGSDNTVIRNSSSRGQSVGELQWLDPNPGYTITCLQILLSTP